MLAQRISQFFSEGRNALMRGDIDAVVTRFSVPLPVHYADRMLFYRTSHELAESLAAYHQAIRAQGVTQMAGAHLLTISGDGASRLVTAPLRLLRADGSQHSLSFPSYVVQTGPNIADFRIQLVEHSVIAIPELAEHLSSYMVG